MSGKSAERQQYVNIFNDLGADWETIVNMRDTQRETDFIQSALPKKGTTLDLCCGTGRHSIILRRRGWTMIGLDLSKNLLAIAKRNMKKERVELSLIHISEPTRPY